MRDVTFTVVRRAVGFLKNLGVLCNGVCVDENMLWLARIFWVTVEKQSFVWKFKSGEGIIIHLRAEDVWVFREMEDKFRCFCSTGENMSAPSEVIIPIGADKEGRVLGKSKAGNV